MKDNIRYIFSSLLSFEAAFVLFLFAGKYKNDPRFSWIPVDLTVLFLLLSVAAGVWVLHKRGWRFRPSALWLTGLFGVFVTYALASLLWTPSDTYAPQKAAYLVVFTLWPVLACTMVIGYSRSRLKRFALLLTLLSFWFTFETFFSYVTAAFKSQQQVFALGTNYLGIGRVVGPAALILLVYSTATERRSSVQFFAILVFVLTIAALLVLGGRGPFLATILPALLLLYYGIDVEILKGTIRVRRYVLIVVGLFVGIAAVVLSIGSVKVFATLYRLVMLLSELGGSASARLDMYERALTIWINHPVFGGGIGAWPVLTGWGDYKMYPHNLILEVLSEFGMVGLSLLILPLVYAFGYLKRHFDLRSDPWALLALMLVGNTFINAMFTGDLTDNRTFFAFLGFLVARGYSVTEERTTTRSLARAAARIREVTPSHVDDTQEAEPS